MIKMFSTFYFKHINNLCFHPKYLGDSKMGPYPPPHPLPHFENQVVILTLSAILKLKLGRWDILIAIYMIMKTIQSIRKYNSFLHCYILRWKLFFFIQGDLRTKQLYKWVNVSQSLQLRNTR